MEIGKLRENKNMVRTYRGRQCRVKMETNLEAVQYQGVAELRMSSYLQNSNNSFVNYFALH